MNQPNPLDISGLIEHEAIERALRIRIWNALREQGVKQDEAIRRVNSEIEIIKTEARATLEMKP